MITTIFQKVGWSAAWIFAVQKFCFGLIDDGEKHILFDRETHFSACPRCLKEF